MSQSQWNADRRAAKEKAKATIAEARAEAEQRLLEERGEAKVRELAGRKALKEAATPVSEDQVSEEAAGDQETDQGDQGTE
ncbi:hypothetical protein SEA_CHICKENKING_7 [Microbacterium phage ChickenKing]|nr:hypothetical protein SEA_CHICKENKING_7 [Microbacterium phage ChickenKing]QNL30962.1 hypothetical protein SEA_GAECEO_8 [Microbacterium phage GaeCeo]